MAATAQRSPKERRRPSPYRVLVYYAVIIALLIGIALWDDEDRYSVPLAVISAGVVAASYVHVIRVARKEAREELRQGARGYLRSSGSMD